jgi:hypothetical protein
MRVSPLLHCCLFSSYILLGSVTIAVREVRFVIIVRTDDAERPEGPEEGVASGGPAYKLSTLKVLGNHLHLTELRLSSGKQDDSHCLFHSRRIKRQRAWCMYASCLWHGPDKSLINLPNAHRNAATPRHFFCINIFMSMTTAAPRCAANALDSTSNGRGPLYPALCQNRRLAVAQLLFKCWNPLSIYLIIILVRRSYSAITKFVDFLGVSASTS